MHAPAHKLIAVCNVLLETVQAAGEHGAPAGVMYAALMSVCTLEQFQALMDILVKAGKVTLQGHVYRAVKP